MTTFSAYVAASSDDAYQSGSTVTINGGYPNTNGSTVWVGFRFTNVTIPAGSTINSAYINLSILAADDPDVDIYGNDVDDAATFTTASNDISSRALTTAKVNWTATNIGAYSRKDSPDIKTIVQEIIDRAGWSSGNAIAILFDSLSSNYINFKAYDSGEGATQYAKLTIDYTPPTYDDSLTLGMARAVTPGGVAGSVSSLLMGRAVTAGNGPAASLLSSATLAIARALLVEDALRDWWEPSGSFTPTGVYRGIGAASYAASKSNLISPGTNDLTTPGTAPGWAVGTGWTLNGTSQYFATGLTSDGDYTMIVRFADAAINDDQVLVGGYGGGDNRHWGSPRWYDGKASIGYGTAFDSNVTASGWTSGVLAVSGNKLYRDGTAIQMLSGTFSGSTYLNLGALYNNGPAGYYFEGNILAAAFYDGTLTDSQVAEVSAAMAALTSSGGSAETLELLIIRELLVSTRATGISGLTLSRALTLLSDGLAAYRGSTIFERSQDLQAGALATSSETSSLERLLSLFPSPASGLGDSVSLESSLDLLLADGRLALDSLMLARTLQAGAGVAAASTDVLAVEILELLLIGSQTSQQVELLVPRQQSLSASGLADAQGPLSLTRGHGLNLDRVVTLAEIVSLSLAQGVDVVGLLSAGESTWLSESRGLGADSDGLWTATLELSRTHAIGGNELAALFLELQLERVNSTDRKSVV